MISKIFLYFIIYSFLGWSIEVIDKFIQYKKFINRGFLIGVICPIYGVGALLILLINSNTSNALFVFFKSIIICSILEYFTSYILEKIYNTKWWDYSNKKFNINGRICLKTLIPFGIMGTFVVYFITPFITYLIDLIPSNIINIISIIIFIIFIIDLILSLIITYKLKNKIKSNKDNTIYIRKEVLKLINNYLKKSKIDFNF